MLNSFPLGTPNVAYVCELETKRRKFRRGKGGGGGKENKNKTNKKKQGNNKHYTESHCQNVSDTQWKEMGRYQSTNKTQTPNKTFLLLMLLYSIGAIQIFPNNSDGSFITRFEDKTLKVVRKN